MKKAKQYTEEIYEALMTNDEKTIISKMNEVYKSIAVHEFNEIKKMRNVKTDNGLIPIFKEQRKKYGVIAERVNEMSPNLLSITDFDEVIQEIYPNIFNWYKENVL